MFVSSASCSGGREGGREGEREGGREREREDLLPGSLTTRPCISFCLFI